MFSKFFKSHKPSPARNIYGFKAKTIDGEEISMSKYMGKVVVIVNVASQLNYTQLVQLDEEYKDRGLEIVAFPCNQFGNQEPGTNEEIKTFVAKYNTKFQMMDKIDVNGSNEHPLYTYLKSQLRGTLIDAIKWNFTKVPV
ncbi:phospholipid-hydroperoxide glutathione peroxidase [Jimgerdemannia flammicorona]|uniref:Glutathione peroxidase n=1 Tax=Jimgerdemannia flammicorona TaxID=994334 RepID=A0A432ZZM8_9FUNG|nr:phospholipid-hydroperoxide glutathione peroxidase [Jimgerdemannia flammicorona]